VVGLAGVVIVLAVDGPLALASIFSALGTVGIWVLIGAGAVAVVRRFGKPSAS
jgi:hypothetical protein